MDVTRDHRSRIKSYISPARSKINAHLNVGLERVIGSNVRLSQKLRHNRLCRYVKDSCEIMH